ncbi:SPASM domain-containing protein [Enterococcus saccharolyticus]|uniref:radical SAM/SPASM domain-containing protein n=1 Tax=Enterococcus saccharolyticus TaxID=41997 RepID=UPI001E2D920B|nr:SPASM domain-containing protein [Enterococcus saccharolyticus]MCD5002370.1 SPASM domain-containing protein [Enterococcus saccharolyticus]
MKHISVLIKPASSLCNLRCKYCFYADVSSLREVQSFGKMKKDVVKKMIENIYADLEDGDKLTLAFQGGEPTLAGLNYFKYIVNVISEQEKKVRVYYSIQTNGTIINHKWCQFFKENNFLVGLSIDGHPLYHDLHRVNHKGKGTFQRIIETKNLFDEYSIDYNIMCVLTAPLSEEPEKVFQFIKEQNIKYIQFIPCLDELHTQIKSNFALTPKQFAKFYQNIIHLWLTELRNGKYISIKLFDDLINLLVNRQITSCGILGNCQIQYVIEADGSVYPCDFYVLDEYRMGHIQEKTLKELFEQDISQNFLCEKEEMSSECSVCPFVNICRGGCKRMKDAMYVDDQGFCGYQYVLQNFIPKIDEIIEVSKEATF